MEENEVVETSEKELEVAEPIEETTEVNEEVLEDSIDAEDTVEEKNNTEDKQSKEDNRAARNARLRAENEYKERLAKKTKLAYEKGLKEAEFKSYIGKVNPYTGKSIQDELDIEEYKDMLDIDSKGGDPLKDYSDIVKQKSRADRLEKQKAEEKKAQELKTKEDIDSFFAKYPDVNIKELFKDPKFSKFVKGKVGNQDLTEIYEDFNELMGNVNTQAEEKAKKIIANTKASPGSLGNGQSKEIDFDNMSDDEFEKYEKAIASGKIKFKR